MIILALGLAIIWLILHLTLRSKPLRSPIIISHRGAAALAPENTLAGIRTALERGAKFVEVDVQRTADNALVVMHDATVNRTTDGYGTIRDMTWDEIRQLDAGTKFSPAFAGEPVPSLDQVLKLLASTSAHLILEIKSSSPGIAQQIVSAIQSHALADRVTVISFDHDLVRQVYRQAPEVRIGYLALWCGSPPRTPKGQAIDVHWFAPLVDPTLVHRLHRNGYQVWVWTVNDKRLLSLLLWLGVDGVTTDRPALGLATASDSP